jgi:hypothetical protein
MCVIVRIAQWIVDPNNLTAISTAGIFAFTVVLACVTRKQAAQTREIITLTRDEFNATHRPRLRIKHVWLKSDIWEKEEVKIDLVIVNGGDAPAIVTQCTMATLLVSQDDALPNAHDTWVFNNAQYEMGVGLTVRTNDMSDGRVLSDADNVALREETKFLYCLGAVDYIDRSSPPKLMKTAFCRILKMPSQVRPGAVGRTSRFVRPENPDPDYEYED